jgi:inhibitor of cysteine peptidase
MALRKILYIATVFAFLLLTAGCRSGQTKLTSSDNGRTFVVRVGDRIIVALAGNPSTGYTWETKNLDSAMLEQVGETAFTSSTAGLPGAGGSLSLTFKALKAGTTSLHLEYHRPWEKIAKPLGLFEVALTIK